MSYEYAGSLFGNEHAAQLAALHDWITATGSNGTGEVVAEACHELTRDQYVDELVDDIERGDWHMPGIDAPTTEDERWEVVHELRDLVDDWIEENAETGAAYLLNVSDELDEDEAVHRIAVARKLLGESQEAFGRRVHHSRDTIASWETGRRAPDARSRRELRRVAEEMGEG